MIRLLEKKGVRLVIGLYTFIFGLRMLLIPGMMKPYEIFQYVDSVFEWDYISYLFIVLGIATVVSALLRYKKVFKVAVTMLTMLWTFFGVTFMLTEPPNELWSESFLITALLIIVAIQEE